MKNIIALLFLFVLSVAQAIAQKDSLLTRYRSMVKKYSKDIKAADYDISAKQEQEKSAKADFLPSIDGNADFKYTANPMQISRHIPSLELPLELSGRNTQYGASVTIDQPVYSGGAIKAGYKKAQMEKNMSQEESSRILNDILYQADIYYWNKVAKDEMKNVALEIKNSVSQLVDVVKDRLREGYTDRNDLIMAEVKLNDAEYQYVQACNNAEIARLTMNSYSGVPFNEFIETDTAIAVPSHSVDNYLAMTQEYTRPELNIADNLVDIKKSDATMANAMYLPKLSVGATGSYSSPGYDFKADMDPNYAVYATLNIPVFNWGKRRNTRKAGEFEVMIAKENKEKVTDNIKLEIETAKYSYTESVSKVILTESSLNKAAESENIALEKYKEGSISIIEVINVQMYHHDAMINYINSKLEAQIAKSALLRAIGVTDR